MTAQKTSLHAFVDAQKSRYKALLQHPSWHAKRKQILERDGHVCKSCKSGSKLQVHHRQYHMHTSGSWFAPWSYSDHLLIALCDDCHTTGHALYTIPTFTAQ